MTQEAWLCVAGNDSVVKVYNVQKGTLVKVGLVLCRAVVLGT